MTSTGKEVIREQHPDKKRHFHSLHHSRSGEERITKIDEKIAKLELRKSKEDEKHKRAAEETERKRLEREDRERRRKEEDNSRLRRSTSEEQKTETRPGLFNRIRLFHSTGNQTTSCPLPSYINPQTIEQTPGDRTIFRTSSNDSSGSEFGEEFEPQLRETCVLIRSTGSEDIEVEVGEHLTCSSELDSSCECNRPPSPVPSFIYDGPTRSSGEHRLTKSSSETSVLEDSPEIPVNQSESCFMDSLILPPILPGENEPHSTESDSCSCDSEPQESATETPTPVKQTVTAPESKTSAPAQESKISNGKVQESSKPQSTDQPPSNKRTHDKIGWCSWCAHYGTQNLMILNRYGRNNYNCDDCCRNTSSCSRCKDGFAKRFGSGHGEKIYSLCAVCDGTFSSWDKAVPPSIEGWCSHCFTLSQHSLHKKNRISKNIYQCQQCNKHTSPCKCKEAFAKARGESAGNNCAKCKKKIKDWNRREENLNIVSREGWCSWCFEKTRHETEKDSKIKRIVYACRGCRLRTKRCYSCDIGMAKGGYIWDDHMCASCAIGRKVVWEDIKKKKDEVLSRPRDINKIKEDLKRDSEYKRKALKTGCIRPFLIMVAMAPMFRFQIASCLGWTLFTEPYFGDSHAESWKILERPQYGMRFRTSSSYEKINVFGLHSTWYDMLIRTADVGFSYQLPSKLIKGNRKQRKCIDSKDKFIPEIEEEFLSMMAHLMRSQMSKKEREDQTRSVLGDSAAIIQRKIFENCGITRKDVGNYGYNVINNIQQTLGISAQLKLAALQMSQGIITHATTAVCSLAPTSLANVANAATVASAAATTGTSAGVWVPQVLSIAVPKLAGVIGSIAAVATAQMALLSTPLFFLGFLGLAKTGFDLIFGSSEGRVFVPVTIILNQRILLAVEGIRIEDYY